MSAPASPVESPLGDKPVDDGQETEYQDALAAADSDRDSDALSEVDENQFEDYDPETANIENRPVDIDEDVAATLKVTKRKRIDGEANKKPREGRREKKRRDQDEDAMVDDASDTETAKKQRRSRRAADGARKPRAKATEPAVEDDESLTPEERKKRAIERALDSALKKNKGTSRRRKDEDDLEDELDEQMAQLKVRMDNACQADNAAREAGKPALHKLKLLPQVSSMLNRGASQNEVLDPDVNFLQHVKFFLEPLNDGSLPAYNIQRDIFTALVNLNITKDALLSSGIGKVVLFYTRSKRPEPKIKRMAETLVGDWSRPILNRTTDYRQRQIKTAAFDYYAAKEQQRVQQGSQYTLSERPAQSARDAERERLLAPASAGSRARAGGLPATYTIAPQSTFDPAKGSEHRPLGAGGMEAFRRMTQKGKKKN